MICRNVVAPPDQEVTEISARDVALPTKVQIVKYNLLFIRDAKTPIHAGWRRECSSIRPAPAFSWIDRLILGFIGVLTLGVGGVGVTNIMLVSVTERTKEVGLRKALGARNRDIALQFLVEALVLTFVAGAVGMLVSIVLAHAIPPMPLYSEMYKTVNHEGDIFLKTSGSVMLTAFLILAFVFSIYLLHRTPHRHEPVQSAGPDL